MKPKSPLPWLHIAEVAAAVAVELGYRRVGITGTCWLTNSSVYPDALTAKGMDFVLPWDDEPAHLLYPVFLKVIVSAES